jgi:RNase P/RNase MRP subunit POP5
VPKSKRERFRYILFGVATGLQEREVVYFLMRHLTSNLDPSVKMIRFRNGYGIVRVARKMAIEARRTLEATVETPHGSIALRPILTSGTLLALKKRSSHAVEALRRG